MTTLSEVASLRRILLKRPAEAFIDAATVAAQWRDLNFTAPPDINRASDEYDRFVEALRTTGAELVFLPHDRETTLDSIYVRDASVVAPGGVILCRMGKRTRAHEPAAQRDALAVMANAPPIVGAIEPPGCLEGGDVVWLDPATIVVGRGYRTNDEGIRQLRELLGDSIDELIVVPLPHWKGPDDVFHLMSFLSPIDRDLAVVYSPLMPVPLREQLLDRGMTLVEVPDGEFDSMGCNVLALSPRRAVMVAGSPRTRALLEQAGTEVFVYAGKEISLKGGGGPTCLTRPLDRQGG